MKKYLSTVLCLCLILICGQSLLAQTQPDGKKAWKHVEYLSQDSFKGRKSGTPEYQKAAEYVAQKMKEYGLQPGGDKGSYFQQVDFKNWQHFELPTRLEITSPEHIMLVPGRGADFRPNMWTGSGTSRGGLVFAGYGLMSKQYEWDDYSGLEVKGKVVVLLPGAPDFMEELDKKLQSLDAKIETAVDKKAAGVIFLDAGGQMPGRRYPSGAKKGTCPDNFVVMTLTEQVADRIFDMAGLSWRDMVSRTIREKKSFTSVMGIRVEMEAHYTNEDRKAPNVIGILPGRDPKLKDEYIIVGGHLDHLGVELDGRIYNGADDNAGSAAVILEIARFFQANGFRPDRTVVFASWAGEELGLVGSRYYTKNPVFPLEKTVVYMNMDMVGTGDDDLYVGGMWEFSDFFDLIKNNLPEKYHDKLRYRLDYRGSDHSAFLHVGVTSISLRTGNVLTRELDDEHPEYHRLGDIAATIRPELLELATEYHIDIITFLADTRENLLDPSHHINFIHKDSFVVDLHCDTIGRTLRGVDLSLDNERGHIDIPKLQQGAVDLQVFACYVAPPQNDKARLQAAKQAFVQIDAVHRLVEDNPDDLLLITHPDDLRGLRANHKVGILIGIEGGYAIESSLPLLRSFYRSGVRLMTLTHWTTTGWADASGDPEPANQGLTELGEQIVKEMNRLGMIIDLSHSHDETFWDVLKITDQPVVASHSCCRALSDHHRNLSDEMLKALAENGGMIGINYLPDFLMAENQKKIQDLRTKLLEKYTLPQDQRELMRSDAETRRKFNQEYREKAKELRESLPVVDVKTVVDHIDHVVEVTGNSNHVGLGSDFDGIGSTPIGLEHTGKLANITTELHHRGYKDSDIKKILGGNFSRIFR
ncbi:MAG: M20/M25/M40 family metallo-hydrolase, partial [Candidatus Aminicenantaceae bacterium]